MKNKVIKEYKFKHGKLTISGNNKKEIIQGIIGWTLAIIAIVAAIKMMKG